MKELSIEEKASRYDEAIKRIENIKTGKCKTTFMFTEGLFEYIFPELAESEDERIKDLIYLSIEKGMGIPSAEDRKKALAWIEKQGEQKPYDKVEPKFHEGEWMCENEPNNYARFIQILEIVNVQGKERYRISRDSHNDEDVVEFGFVEKYYHKFDIQDAKDGDVLACNSDILSICIFAHFDGINNKYDSFLCYCGLEGEGLGQELNINGYHDDSTGYVPATKEQRDTLEKAITNAGYRWDKEKLKLEKV